jgi:Protein of unknown function (DUF2721)
MTLTLTVPATLFPAISFLLLPYTNRYLALANLIRNLLAEWQTTSDERLVAQISVLRRRLSLIKAMQTFAVISMLCAVMSILALWAKQEHVGGTLFAAACVGLAVSLVVALFEINLSTDALNVQLEQIASLEAERSGRRRSSAR